MRYKKETSARRRKVVVDREESLKKGKCVAALHGLERAAWIITCKPNGGGDHKCNSLGWASRGYVATWIIESAVCACNLAR